MLLLCSLKQKINNNIKRVFHPPFGVGKWNFLCFLWLLWLTLFFFHFTILFFLFNFNSINYWFICLNKQSKWSFFCWKNIFSELSGKNSNNNYFAQWFLPTQCAKIVLSAICFQFYCSSLNYGFLIYLK